MHLLIVGKGQFDVDYIAEDGKATQVFSKDREGRMDYFIVGQVLTRIGKLHKY